MSLSATPGLCYAYITGQNTFEVGLPPQPVECGTNRFDRNKWIAPSFFQQNSCCDSTGNYFVGNGEVGGFEAGFEVSDPDETCFAYAHAMKFLLCDPDQGKFVVRRDGEEDSAQLRVCRSSCDALFQSCGSPGENFFNEAEYHDGTSLCHALWGGFGDSPCEGQPEGFVCSANLTISVEDEDCLSLVEPTSDGISYLNRGIMDHPSACDTFQWNVIFAEAALILAFFGCNCFACAFACFLYFVPANEEHDRKNQEKGEEQRDFKATSDVEKSQTVNESGSNE